MSRHIVCAGIAACVCSAASAQLVKDLGFGWEVVIVDPDRSDVAVDPDSTVDLLILQKTAQFDSLNPILLQFRQTMPDDMTAPMIAFNDELIYNNSGYDWVDFEFDLLDGTQVSYDQAASANFSINPFTSREYRYNDSQLHVYGGVVPDGDIWTPGLASGKLYIDINLASDDPVVWTFKEIPSVPAPGALALLGLGVLAGNRRRR